MSWSRTPSSSRSGEKEANPPTCSSCGSYVPREGLYCPDCGSSLGQSSHEEPENRVSEIQAWIQEDVYEQHARGTVNIAIQNWSGKPLERLEVDIESECLERPQIQKTRRNVSDGAEEPFTLNIKPMEKGEFALTIHIVYQAQGENINVLEAEHIIGVRKEKQSPSVLQIDASRNISEGSEAYGIDNAGDVNVHIASEGEARQQPSKRFQSKEWRSLPLRLSEETARLFCDPRVYSSVPMSHESSDTGARAHSAWLVLKYPDGRTQRAYLHFQKSLTLGKHPDVEVTCLPQNQEGIEEQMAYMSRRHLTLRFSGDTCYLEDHSTNGTWVDGTKIHQQSRQVQNRQIITLCDQVHFRYQQFKDLSRMQTRLRHWHSSRHSSNDASESLVGLKQEMREQPLSAACLQRLNGEQVQCEYFVLLKDLDLGSDESNALVLKHQSVSDLHAKLFFGNNQLRLIDLASQGGTLVNQRKLGPYEAVEVRQGDRIQLGDVSAYLHFVGQGDSGGKPPGESK